MTLKINTSRVLQALTGAADLLNLFSGQVSPKYQPLIAAALVFIHYGINELAHKSNPDGTPAVSPVQGESK